MKAILVPLSLLAVGLTSYLVASPPSPKSIDPPSAPDLSSYERITQRPHKMHDSTAVLCAAPLGKIAVNPHEPSFPQVAFCHVYCNAKAKATMLSGKGIYPEGSVIIKSKLSSMDDDTPELFTVMQKMPAGYDKEHGDWKYSVMSGSAYREVAAGRIESCIDCHKSYTETDYVTRAYLGDARQIK